MDAASRPIGQRRIEILLAQLTLYVCSVWGGVTDATLGDYLAVLDPPDPDAEAADDKPLTVEEQQAVFGFTPTIRKKERPHVEQPGPPGGPARP